MGPKEYAAIITDKRSIFILEKSSKAGIAGALGGGIAAAIAQAAATRRTADYEQGDLGAFAADPKNMVIPHEALERIQVKKNFLGPIYRLNIQFKTIEEKSKKVKGHLTPPSEHTKQKKQEGLGRKQIHYGYAKKVQELYQRALPATASAQLADWRI